MKLQDDRDAARDTVQKLCDDLEKVHHELENARGDLVTTEQESSKEKQKLKVSIFA